MVSVVFVGGFFVFWVLEGLAKNICSGASRPRRPETERPFGSPVPHRVADEIKHLFGCRFHKIKRLFASYHARPPSSYCTKKRRFSRVRVSPAFFGQIRTARLFWRRVTVRNRAFSALPCLDGVAITERLFVVFKDPAVLGASRRYGGRLSVRRCRVLVPPVQPLRLMPLCSRNWL